ncbi:MAG: hypothetical protein U0795_23735 [Pirellulales bacterium]
MLVDLFLRWGHIYAAIALVGSIWFWCSALHPAVPAGPTEWFAAMRRRWAPVVHACTAVLLATGLFNFVQNVMTYKLPPWYHALGLVKLLLALGLFFIAGKLVGSSQGAQKFQQEASKWLGIAALLGVILVGLAGVMRAAPRSPKNVQSPAPAAAVLETPASTVSHGPGAAAIM